MRLTVSMMEWSDVLSPFVKEADIVGTLGKVRNGCKCLYPKNLGRSFPVG